MDPCDWGALPQDHTYRFLQSRKGPTSWDSHAAIALRHLIPLKRVATTQVFCSVITPPILQHMEISQRLLHRE